jgi:hypothetical protein
MMRINALFPEARELFVVRELAVARELAVVGELAVARELAPAGVRSAPRIFGAAAQPSGSKLPRHRGALAAG